MILQTTIKIQPIEQAVAYGDGLLYLGSCFADEVGSICRGLGFNALVNPFGVLYNPASIAQSVERMPDIEAMLTSSQRNVTGTAILKLRPYGFETVGVDSANDLTKSKLGEYGETQTGWTADEAKGFIKVSSTPLRVYYGIHKDEKR